MICFIPSAAAENLSKALWTLARPPQVTEEGTTTSLFPWVVDLHGASWIMVDTDYSIPIHPEAELNGIADILQPWIDTRDLAADTNTRLTALVESLRGQSLVVYDAFPQLFKDMSKTREEMITAGFLAGLS